MEVYATTRQKVDVDPLDVIENLIEDFLGDSHNWIEQDKDRCLIMTEKSAGQHSYSDIHKEITVKEKDYYDSLKNIERFLNKSQ